MSVEPDPLGRRGSRERRVAERRAVIDAHFEIAQAAIIAGLESGWLDQVWSPLGRVRHIAAVRRRLAAGAPGAARVGRRFLLTIDAVVDEVFGSRVRSMRRVARAVARLGRAANDNGGRA